MMGKIRYLLPAAAMTLIGVAGAICPVAASVVARYSGEFMAGGAGARSQAMGNASVALANEAWAIFLNPAGLEAVNRPNLGLMHSERFAGVVDYDAAAYAFRAADGKAMGIGLLRLGVNGIPFTRLENPGEPPGDGNRVEVSRIVSDGEYALYAGRSGRFHWSRVPALRFDWGLAPKLIFKHVGDYAAYGLGLDAGAARRWGEEYWVSAGASAKDVFGTLLVWDKTGRSEVIVPTAAAGIACGAPLIALEAEVIFAADGGYRVESLGDKGAASYSAGVEYRVRKVFSLRIGSDDGEPTFGGGIDLKPVAIDYAFIGHDYLGDSHRISITARWGK